MSSFIAKKLDLLCQKSHIWDMENRIASTPRSRHAAKLVRQRIERGNERLWRYADFGDLPFPAVAQALSRLTRAGMIERLSKGVYYRSRQTAFGKSRPNPAAIGKLASKRRTVFPAGIAAANLLGFTTQNPSAAKSRPVAEASHASSSAPRPSSTRGARRHGAAFPTPTRRCWTSCAAEGRKANSRRKRPSRGRLPSFPKKADSSICSKSRNSSRRVSARCSGRSASNSRKPPKALERLRRTLNPLSRFDFGALTGLACAQRWYAKERRRA